MSIKKIGCILILLVILCCEIAFSQNWSTAKLTCDPYHKSIGITGFALTFDNGTSFVNIPTVDINDNQTTMMYPIIYLPNGLQCLKAKALTATEESELSEEFCYSKYLPDTPESVNIVNE